MLLASSTHRAKRRDCVGFPFTNHPRVLMLTSKHSKLMGLQDCKYCAELMCYKHGVSRGINSIRKSIRLIWNNCSTTGTTGTTTAAIIARIIFHITSFEWPTVKPKNYD